MADFQCRKLINYETSIQNLVRKYDPGRERPHVKLVVLELVFLAYKETEHKTDP